ncbi:MAG: hypothetical protein LQ339_002741 [Xanthoria mediterranea]|nr:MAG: hypothetical protein LQ339_002741 [Xanthoria mediterranea]
MANRSAPWLNIPPVPIVAVEHPFLITDLTKAVDSLGSSSKMEKLVGKDSAILEADLYLRPGDRNSKPIASFNSKTNNVLVKITVPQRTGRKRKRGSHGDWLPDAEVPASSARFLSDPRDARRLARSMQDNSIRCQVETIGSISQTHRFRRLPDFVWSTERSPFMTKMKEHILPFDYTKLKNFKFDMSKGIQEENDIVPPPRWTHQTVPFNYSYRQNPAVHQILSTTGHTTRNMQAPRRNRIPMVTHDISTVPTTPPGDIPPENSLPDSFRLLLTAMRDILVQRPVCTRRYLQNHVPIDIWKKVGPNAAKQLWQYVGYIWNSGPWRDSICALGIDPRKDRQMRWYQTMMFQLEAEPGDTRLDRAKTSKTMIDRELAATGKNREGHIFDGRTVGLDGKVWQLCDITDPLLRGMLETSTLRDECHELSDGWFTNGTMAKLRVIMKAKLQMILTGNVDNAEQNEELLVLSQTVPDVMTAENRSAAIFNNVSKRMIGLAETLRAYVTRPDGSRAGGWGHLTKDQQPRKLRKTGTKGVVSFKLPANKGGRPPKGQKETKLGSGETAREERVALDPWLTDAMDGLEEAEREATMRAFEDTSDGPDDESRDENSATSSGSEEDDEDTEGGEDTTEEDEEEGNASGEAAVEDDEVASSL